MTVYIVVFREPCVSTTAEIVFTTREFAQEWIDREIALTMPEHPEDWRIVEATVHDAVPPQHQGEIDYYPPRGDSR